MSVVETLLVFAGAPFLVVAVLAVLVFRRGRQRPRYKPGQPWNHPPVWYEPHPDGPPPETHAPSRADAVAARLAIGQRAHGTPDEHLQAVAATGGPLGGARGTW